MRKTKAKILLMSLAGGISFTIVVTIYNYWSHKDLYSGIYGGIAWITLSYPILLYRNNNSKNGD
jgi:hypothetical protein